MIIFRMQRLALRPCRIASMTLAVLLSLASSSAWAEDFALLVAARDYATAGKSGLRSLKYSRNDIVDLGATLIDCGYKKRSVVMMYDGHPDSSKLPEYEKIKEQLDLMLTDLSPGDSVLVALAGHGVQFAKDKVNYFCPLDADIEAKRNLLSLTEVYELLRRCSAGRKMLLVDACRDDPVNIASRGAFEKMDLESETRPQLEDVPEQTIAIFSCNTGQRSWEDDRLKHGVFFAHVLKGLKGEADRPSPDGRVTVRELADYVKEETQSYAKLALKQVQRPIVKNEGEVEWVLRALKADAAAGAPGLAEAHRLLASGEYARARDAYVKALRTASRDPKAYLGRGLAALSLNDLPAAEADFLKATQLDASSVAAWKSLGGARGRAGKFAESVQAYSEALKLDPDAVDALAGRAAAQIQLGRLDPALDDLNRALRAQPDHVDALYNRALVHQKRGDSEASRRDLERAKSLEGVR